MQEDAELLSTEEIMGETTTAVDEVDRDDARILAFTYESPRSVVTISTITGIPIAECYRRVRKLVLLGLLEGFRLRMNSIPDFKSKMFYYANTSKVKVVAHKGKSRIALRGSAPSTPFSSSARRDYPQHVTWDI